ncbi:MAG: hypothetical protein COA41_07210 [Sphingopyxis sp.]|nr:MAG: hypothetical protein COA41_07210 [Sphingopyxis sp.]
MLSSNLAAAFATVAVISIATPAYAQTQQFNIPAGSLKSALDAYTKQTGRQIIYKIDEVRSARSPGVQGAKTADAALAAILEETGFQVNKDRSGAIAIVKVNTSTNAAPNPRPQEPVIVVTGTNIRGIAPESSPTKVFTRDDIERSGAATAQEFINKLPENFGGGSNAAVPAGLPNDNSAGANSGGFGSYGSSVNLRGLGSGSTLVLLNGHRVAPSSVFGDFTDISMIPASAIDRVETLNDGASSIYGSDAVAGVVNFILRDDFDGLETSVRYGAGTQGGAPDQVRVNLTGGKSWDTGHALLIYEYFDQKHLGIEDRDFTIKDFAPSFLLPSQKRNSVVATISQDVSSRLTFSGDGLYSRRKSRQLRTDVTGQTFQYDAVSEAANFSAAGAWQLSDDWFFDFSGAYGRVDTRNSTSGDATQERSSKSDVWSFDAKLAGPVLELPAGEAKIALGGHYRNEALESTNVTAGLVDRNATRNVYAVYGEAFIPLISPDNDISGLRRLELSLSGRYSDYSDFGTTVDPKVGVLLSPLEGLNFRGSYSTSFKAPALGLVGARDFGASLLRTSFLFPIFGLTPADPSLADVVQLTVGGTDNELDPESSRSWTAGVDFSRDWGRHGFSASATWFDINFKNRLGNIPIPGNVIHFDAINIAFEDPSAFPVGSYTFQPSPEEINSVLASLDTPLGNPFGLNPSDTFFISRLLILTNTSRTLVRGFDFQLDYTYSFKNATLDIGLDGTYLKDFKQQATSSSPIVQQINSLFQPVDLKMRGRLGYSAKNFSTSIFLNYIDSYKVDDTPTADSIKSWTTVDLTMTFDTKDNLGGQLFRNTALRLSISNLFDKDPPRIPFFSNLRVDGYDPTNASPLGRFVSLELIKRF